MTRHLSVALVLFCLSAIVVGLVGCPPAPPQMTPEEAALEDATEDFLDSSMSAEQAYQSFVVAFEEVADTSGLDAAIDQVDEQIAGAIHTEQDLVDLLNRGASVPAGSYGSLAKSLKAEQDTVVLFVNGIWNLHVDVVESKNSLRDCILVVEPRISVQHFYNPTGNAALHESRLGKITLDLEGLSRSGFYRLADVVGQFARVQDLEECFVASTFDEWALHGDDVGTINAQTVTDLTETIRAYLDLPQIENVIVVPHSQGNFYSRDALEQLTTQELEHVAVVEVASPSSSMPTGPGLSLRIDVRQDPVPYFSVRRGADGFYEYPCGLMPEFPPQVWALYPVLALLAQANSWCFDSHNFVDSYMDDTMASKDAIVSAIEGFRLQLLGTGGAECIVLGGDTHSYTETQDLRANVVTVSTPRTLTDIQMEMEFSDQKTIYYYVLESSTVEGPYTPVHEEILQVTGRGKAFYGTGGMTYNLVAGKFYAVGFLSNNAVTYYRSYETDPLPIQRSWGTVEGNVYGHFSAPMTGSSPWFSRDASYSMRLCLD